MQRNGSLFRSLHRRGGSPPLPPLVSVESFNSLRLTGHSCWQAGPFRSLPGKLRELRQSRRSVCIAVKEKLASRRDSRSSVAEDMFFHTPAKNTPRPASSTAAREAERFSFQISSGTAARNSAAPGKRLSEERGKGARAHAFYSARQFRKCFRPAYCVSTICTVGSSMRISSTAPFSLRPSTTACAFSCRA